MFLECGDLSPLCLVATWRDQIFVDGPPGRPGTKAVTGHRTPKIVEQLKIRRARKNLSEHIRKNSAMLVIVDLNRCVDAKGDRYLLRLT